MCQGTVEGSFELDNGVSVVGIGTPKALFAVDLDADGLFGTSCEDGDDAALWEQVGGERQEELDFDGFVGCLTNVPNKGLQG